MKKKIEENTKKYYLGLDIGTNSVGWAITDVNYKLLRANNKSLWGVRIFDTANTAKDRRLQRESRRRLERRKKRIELLQQIFAPVINSVDKNFFARLDDSNLYDDDKREKTKFSLFSDADFTDKTFHNKYKTIYHLRLAMMHECNPDPRLVYLALHHIIKYRGHFLQEGESVNAVENNIYQPLNVINAYFQNNDCGCSLALDENSIESFRKALMDKSTKTVRAQLYRDCLQVSKNTNADYLLKLIAGNTVKLKNIFKFLNDNSSVTFDCDWDAKTFEVQQLLQDDYIVIENAKLLYDYSQWKSILGKHDFISEGMVEKYDKHQRDLVLLKRVLDKHFPKENLNCAHSKAYYDMFRDCSDKQTNYTAYCGKVKFGKKNGKVITLKNDAKSSSYEDFCNYVKKVLNSSNDALQDDDVKRILADIDSKTFMPKQVSKNNSTLPYQLNLSELEAILQNVKKYPQYAFIDEVDCDDVSTYEKIKSLLTFRMPYYVGPTNKHSKNYWLVRKSDGTIMPWNYDKAIDLEQTEQNFIERMTNYCVYVPNAKVLPKCSLLYEEFVFLNIVNAITVNGERLPVDVKNKLSQYYATSGNSKISRKSIKEWLRTQNLIEQSDNIEISGFDEGATVHRRTYYQFFKMFGNSVDHVELYRKDIEKIIKYATIAGPEKTTLVKRIKKEFPYLSEQQIAAIKGLSLNGWGRYSENMLTYRLGMNPETGELDALSIIEVMRNTTLNFMEVWHSPCYGFKDSFEKLKSNDIENGITYKIVNDLYCSPAVKKQIWQALSVVKELISVLGHPPAKIFVEVARGEGPKDKAEEKKRTTSRYEQLRYIYEDLKKQNDDIFDDVVQEAYAHFGERKPDDLKNQKLYLYFLQNGRDIYTGERIDYNHLELYEKDHIYPRSKVKDDSIHNNLVLTYRKNNADKTDIYPISEAIRNNAKIVNFWKSLRKQGLMTEEKYRRLTRTTQLADEEIADFINRQLVETRQSTKETIGLLKQLFPQSEIVWSKASNVSDFRAMKKQVGDERLSRFVKCRELNDLHHAKDAYLNIVVGNVYNIKYGHNAKYWLKEHPEQQLYSSAKLFERDVKTQSVTAWVAGENGTISQVERTLRSNAILFTQESKVEKGKLFDVKALPKGRDDIIPLKAGTSDNRKFARMSNTVKYGGYTSDKSAYVTLVKVIRRNKYFYKLVSLTNRFINQIHSDSDLIIYCENKLGYKVDKILIPKIKIKSMFEINGAMLTLTSVGTLDDRAIWNNARQFKVDEEAERYFKKVLDVATANAEHKKSNAAKSLTEFDGISVVKNKLLYDLIAESLYKSTGDAPYQNVRILSEFGEKLNSAAIREKFEKLSLVEQCETLVEMHKAVKCNAEESNALGIRCGRIRGSSSFDSLNNMFIVHRSVTGIFENKIPLSDFDEEQFL